VPWQRWDVNKRWWLIPRWTCRVYFNWNGGQKRFS
jgi:hypothetical protein